MVDSPTSSAQVIVLLIVAGVSLVAGMFLVPGLFVDAAPRDGADQAARALEDNHRLTVDLERARAEIARLKSDAKQRRKSIPTHADPPSTGSPGDVPLTLPSIR